jgi:hypothetical protein
MFLVDNAFSMLHHWQYVKLFLETLVQKVDGLDKDGVDVAFTRGSATATNIEGQKGITKIKTAMDSKEVVPMPGVYTDMVEPLRDIFNAYKLRVESKIRRSQKIDKMTLIIITDGLWLSTLNKDSVGQTIVQFVKELKGIMGYDLTDRPFSIQFIQIGDDIDAGKRLQSLDDELTVHGIP